MDQKGSFDRRYFLASVLGVCSFVLLPKSAKAETAETGLKSDVSFLSAAEYIELVDESGVGWDIYEQDGERVSLSAHFDLYQDAEDYVIEEDTRSAGDVIKQVTVYVGKKAIGILKVAVTPKRIIRKVITKAGTALLKKAAQDLIGRTYTVSYTLPCEVYPPHSGEYIRCTSGQ